MKSGKKKTGEAVEYEKLDAWCSVWIRRHGKKFFSSDPSRAETFEDKWISLDLEIEDANRILKYDSTNDC